MRVCPRCRSIYATKVQWCGIDNAALIDQPDDPLIGSELERYRIVESLGVGGMGCVYRASHTFIEREYAIKVLYGDFAGDPKFRERFRREAKSISQIRHPNIVFVEDFGTTPEGLTFLAMEMVHGRTLEKVIEEETPFSPVRAAQIMRQVVAGLGAAHSLGFVHRDVKPSNIMLSQHNGLELVKILDFGAVSMRSVPVDQRLTSVGHIIGTPTYMAPEQSQDPNVGPPADLYAAGVILYEMLTGTPPFVGKGRAEVLIKHIMEEPPRAPPSRGLERVVAQLLRKQPNERPQAAVEVIRMLDALGFDLAIISDAPRVPQSAMPTSEIPRSRPVIDFHGTATRAHTPSTDPSNRANNAADLPTPKEDHDHLAYDTFPVLESSESMEWGWSNDGGTDPLPFVDEFESAPTTRRNVMPEDDDGAGEFGGPTIPIDSLDRDSAATTDPRLESSDSDDLTPGRADDLHITHPVDMRRTMLDEPSLPVGESATVSIRDDGPTQIDFSLMPALQLQRVTTDDVPTGDLISSDESLIPPPMPDLDESAQMALDTAKTLSDGDIVLTASGALTDSTYGATVRDTPAPSESSGIAPTLELPAREDFLEDSEESMSVKARVIPVLDSAIEKGAPRPRYWTVALIALVLMVTMVIVALVFKKPKPSPIVIDSSAQSTATPGQ